MNATQTTQDVCSCSDFNDKGDPIGPPCPVCRQQEFNRRVDEEDLKEEVRVYRATRNEELPEPIFACDLEVETLTWLIQDYIPEGAVGLLAAPRGVAKSFVALDWACSVACGRKWLGFQTTKGTAMYVAAEGA